MLSVIIPSKTASNLIPCVKAVRKHEPGVDIIWIDDRHKSFYRSTDDDEHAEVSRAAGAPYITTIKGIAPFVFSRNVNLGIKAALGIPIDGHPGAVGAPFDGVVLLNDDALLQTPGGFSVMAQACREHPEYGIIGAVTDLTGQPLQRPRGIGLRQVPHIAFVCCYIPRITFERVGLLDENYNRDYGVEDRDMCEAVNRIGMKVGVHDGCFVNHSSLVSSFRGDPRAPKSFQQNYAYFKQKWGIME